MKNSKGFTLLEVVVSLLIISLVIAGGFSIFKTSEQQMKLASLRKNTSIYCQQTIEELLSKDFYTGNSLAEGVHTYELPEGEFKNRWNGERSYKVENIWDEDNDDLKYKKVNVTVNWDYPKGEYGKEYSEELTHKFSSGTSGPRRVKDKGKVYKKCVQPIKTKYVTPSGNVYKTTREEVVKKIIPLSGRVKTTPVTKSGKDTEYKNKVERDSDTTASGGKFTVVPKVKPGDKIKLIFKGNNITLEEIIP